GSMFINLKPYPLRREPFVTEDGKVMDLSADSILGRLIGGVGTIPHPLIQIFPPPPARGRGPGRGLRFLVGGPRRPRAAPLQHEPDNLILKANQPPGLTRLFTAYRANVPQLHVQPNKRECESRGVKEDDVNTTLVVYQGSLYVNDFNLLGRTWQVIVQSDEE